MADSLLKGIEDFVNRAPSKSVADKVSKYVSKLGSQGNVSNERVLHIGKSELNSAEKEEDQSWGPLQALFAPVGYRPLFEQEIVFLLNEGLTYESIMSMPVYLRKKLIDKKLERNRPHKATDEPDIPPALLEQFRMAAQERREAEMPLPSRE
jgi:hypothetical protein